MTTPTDAAVDALHALAINGTANTDALSPFAESGVDTGFQLQLAVLDRWLADGEQVGGWKIGLTSRSARDSMGKDVRPPGYVLASRVLSSGASLPPVAAVRLEPEIGIVLGQDITAEITVDQAKAAVAAVAPAFEINALRLPATESAAARVGNALNNWGVVFGEPIDPDAIDLATLSVTLTGPDGPLATGRSGADMIDDPYLSLTRLAATLARNGRGLTAGQHIITGSLTDAVPISKSGRYEADFGALGTVTLNI
ncbi:MAG TPA: fumarylacetoacetate hydrolase family protein [Pseudonocardiaceae bacterium]|jgi:2-keto-4-pentenoate hydratase